MFSMGLNHAALNMLHAPLSTLHQESLQLLEVVDRSPCPSRWAYSASIVSECSVDLSQQSSTASKSSPPFGRNPLKLKCLASLGILCLILASSRFGRRGSCWAHVHPRLRGASPLFVGCYVDLNFE